MPKIDDQRMPPIPRRTRVTLQGPWTLAPVPGQPVRGFATLNLALAVTALAAAALAGLSVAHRTTA